MNIFLKKIENEVQALIFFGFGLFLCLSLLSYVPSDPSFNSIGQGWKTANYCGLIGSFTADAIFQVFGLMSWVIVTAFFHAAWTCFRGTKVNFKDARHIVAVVIVACLAALASVYWPASKLFAGQIYPGGLIGLGFSTILVKILNSVGAQILLWTVVSVLSALYFEIRPSMMLRPFHYIMNFMENWWSEFSIIEFYTELMAKTLRRKAEKVTAEKMAIGNTKNNTKNNLAQNDVKSRIAAMPVVQPMLPRLIPQEEASDIEPIPENETIIDIPQSKAAIQVQPKSGDPEDVQVSTYEPVARRKVVMPVKAPRRIENWTMPKLSLLEDPPVSRIKIDEKEIRRKAEITLDKLKQFDVNGQIVAAKPGPVVTMFEFRPNADVRVNKVTDLADDLSLALSAESLRIIAPIPGRDVIGIETSNALRETVYLKDLLSDEQFWSDEFKLPIALGKQTNGDPKIVDLRKMPHLLIAGTTGSGKSVFTVSTITGFLFKHSPKTLRMILVDPKQVDLAAFANIPHLIMPPIRDPKKAVFALRWAVKEMEKRYKSMSKFGARNIEQFNETVEKFNSDQVADHEKINGEFENQGIMKLEQYYYTAQPYIVIAVEEFGDLMAVDKQNVEQNIVRLAQMARACGMHLILAMQSPRKEVVTGLIKTNIPGRISFKVASKMDSRIILDEQGAERLLAQGDMLFLAGGAGKSVRHHGPYLKESEINAIAEFWSSQGEPEFDSMVLRALEGNSGQQMSLGGGGVGTDGFSGEDDLGLGSDEDYDERYDEILAWAGAQKAISASLIQRRFKLGYPRAARLIELFEREGVVGPANGSKPRAVLVNSHAG